MYCLCWVSTLGATRCHWSAEIPWSSSTLSLVSSFLMGKTTWSNGGLTETQTPGQLAAEYQGTLHMHVFTYVQENCWSSKISPGWVNLHVWAEELYQLLKHCWYIGDRSLLLWLVLFFSDLQCFHVTLSDLCSSRWVRPVPNSFCNWFVEHSLCWIWCLK